MRKRLTTILFFLTFFLLTFRAQSQEGILIIDGTYQVISLKQDDFIIKLPKGESKGAITFKTLSYNTVYCTQILTVNREKANEKGTLYLEEQGAGFVLYSDKERRDKIGYADAHNVVFDKIGKLGTRTTIMAIR